MNRISVRQRLFEALENNHAGTTTEDRPLGRRVESAAVAIGRYDAALVVEVHALFCHREPNPSGHADIRLVIEQALTGQDDGHQRSRARSLHRYAGPSQVEFVTYSSGNVVLLVRCDECHSAHRPADRLVGKVMEQILRESNAGKKTDATAVGSGVVSCVLQRLRGTLQKDSLLRIDDLRFSCHVTKKTGIKQVRTFVHSMSFDVV